MNAPYPCARAYTDPAVLEFEYGSSFSNYWTGIGVASQVPSPGDVCPIEIAGEPLLMVRERSGALGVFFNVCPHRGTKLIDRACARANGLITCPYHTWSFKLDGSLHSAPYWDRSKGSEPDAATRARLALKPVRHAVWYDTVFVNLSGDAPAFDQYIAPLAQRWSGCDPAELRLLCLTEYGVDANWKLVCDNFLDGYHVPWVHSQVGAPETGINYDTVRLSPEIFGAFMPQGEADKPRTADALPVFPRLPQWLHGSQHFMYVYPNTLLALAPDWFQVICVLPKAAGRSIETLAMYLVSDEAMRPQRAEQRARFEQVMRHVNEQDLEILARLQQGRRTVRAACGSYAPYWDELAGIFNARVAAEGAPGA